MKATVERLENDRVKLEIEVDRERVETALERAYRKVVRNVTVPGFRKGKVPRPILERMFGTEVLYEDALDELIPEAYTAAIEENGLEPIDQPEIDVIELAAGKPFRFSALVQLKPEVKLGEYKGVPVTRKVRVVTDDMIDDVLEQYRQRQAQLVEAGRDVVEKGDFVRIDFEGFKDGVPFQGGAAKDFVLEVGSGQMVAGFEEQLIGAKVGDQVDVRITFPADYHNKELAGQDAVFQVTVHDIKVRELPDLDDEFAKSVSDKETLAELRDEIRETLEKEFARRADLDLREDLIKAVTERCEVHVPHVLIHRHSHQLAHEFLEGLLMQGVDPRQYLERTGLTFEDVEKRFESEAEERAKSMLVLEAIGAAEGIVVTDEEIDARIDELVGEDGSDAYRERLNQAESRERIASTLQIDKILDFLVEHAQVSEEVVGDQSEGDEPDAGSPGEEQTDA
ncbi:MAG: trigger factor [Firmicutes bacterium]|nr:trigger factor [Bacillota bacterium]